MWRGRSPDGAAGGFGTADGRGVGGGLRRRGRGWSGACRGSGCPRSWLSCALRSGRSRRIGVSGTSPAGTGRPRRAHRIGFESWVERDHLVALDFDPAVVGIVSQPFWLLWSDPKGVPRRHAPDFLVLSEDSVLVLDSRPRELIKEGDRAAFETTGRACALLGWRYAVMGPPRRGGGGEPELAGRLPASALFQRGGGGPAGGGLRAAAAVA